MCKAKGLGSVSAGEKSDAYVKGLGSMSVKAKSEVYTKGFESSLSFPTASRGSSSQSLTHV
jgi:hypothetical protein